MGMSGIVMSCAPAAGPVVAGALIDAIGWRAMFWSMVPLAVIVLAVSFFLLANVGELKRPHLDVPSILLSSVAFGCLLYGFSSASTLGWASPLVLAPHRRGRARACVVHPTPTLHRRAALAAACAEERAVRLFGRHRHGHQLGALGRQRHPAHLPAERARPHRVRNRRAHDAGGGVHHLPQPGERHPVRQVRPARHRHRGPHRPVRIHGRAGVRGLDHGHLVPRVRLRRAILRPHAREYARHHVGAQLVEKRPDRARQRHLQHGPAGGWGHFHGAHRHRHDHGDRGERRPTAPCRRPRQASTWPTGYRPASPGSRSCWPC